MSGATAKKHLGQHFLADREVLRRIVDALRPEPGELVVEIGSGAGALTTELLDAGLQVAAVEIDPDMVALLQARFGAEPRFSLIEGDARRLDYRSFGSSFKVAGNLPYNVAGPITARLLEHADIIPVMVLMYQREVARRITATPGSRDYGYLTCLVAYHCRAEYLMTVPPGAFRPQPKIHSGVVRLTPAPPPAPPEEREPLLALIRSAFAHRRKTLLNSLAGSPAWAGDRDELRRRLETLGIDPGRRPETFSLDDFLSMSRALASKGGQR